jgi:putative phosphoribosyl transferase
VIFADRTDAGAALASRLLEYRGTPAYVLGLPRGGVPVAKEVARELGVPLDVFIVRKLGAPGHDELAIGAIASGGMTVLNREAIAELGVDARTIDSIAARESIELERRERAYRGGRPLPNVRGKTVILVDDGLATGSSMLAAVRAWRAFDPAQIVVAVPVAPEDTVAQLEREADRVVCVAMPRPFRGVGAWYRDFRQVEDDEVRALLDA